MKKFQLNDEEKVIVKELKGSIPWIFKGNGEYVDYLLTVEVFHMFVTKDLLKGKAIVYEFGTVEDFEKLQKAVKLNELNEQDAEYYSNLVKVFEIFKAYSE